MIFVVNITLYLNANYWLLLVINFLSYWFLLVIILVITGYDWFCHRRSQEANERYTTKFITALFEEEAKGVFITRESVLGHLQQVCYVAVVVPSLCYCC